LNRLLSSAAFAVGLSIVLFLAVSTSASQSCESLTSLSLPDTTIDSATTVPAGPFTIDHNSPFANAPGVNGLVSQHVMLPAYCRVQLTVRPAIHVELWMPAANWNGKFEGLGDQGNAGYINYVDMIRPIQSGYATASTDAGHRIDSTPGASGLEFAYGHPELVVDWAYRAIHEMTLESKKIIESFYGNGPKISYFFGCSNAGRQALMEVQHYPNDYDAVLAGAPQANMTGSIAGEALWTTLALLKDPDSYIPPTMLPIIADAALAACAARDGVKDGFINDPERCNFEPSVLLCKGTELSNCLTTKQVEALKKLYSGPPRINGKFLYPGFMYGSERNWGFSIGTGPSTSANYTRTQGFFRNIVYNDLNWDWHNWDYARDLPEAKKKLSVFETMDPNLQPFTSHGGKLLLYHGWADGTIPPLNTVNYYKSLVATNKHAEDSVRLFMVPGMAHCGGGTGPNTFDAFGALENWVEHKQAPERIIASNAPDNSVKRTRPLCQYPKTAQYTGQGSTDDAASFACKVPSN